MGVGTRLALHVSALLVVLLCAVTARAQTQVPDEIATVADEAGIDPIRLLGAVNTTNLDPRTYLCRVGELPCPAPVFTVWDLLQSKCESPSGGWHTNTGNSYYGGLQMDMTFWRNHGGLAYAPRPDLASREAQIQVAINGRDGLVGKAQGYAAWPVCSVRLGLR